MQFQLMNFVLAMANMYTSYNTTVVRRGSSLVKCCGHEFTVDGHDLETANSISSQLHTYLINVIF